MTRGKRIYVLDTNVLMHDPTALFKFEEHDVYLPMQVIEELDNGKKGTTEGQNFRDLYPQFRKAKCAIFGVSRDSVKSHEGFKAKMQFPFELLSDAEETASKLFGVIKMKNLYGRQVRGIERSTFAFDASGQLAREWRGLKVPGHAQEVLEFVKSLKS